MEGSKVSTCLSNKTWSDAPPICTKIGCRLPDNIGNGYVRYSTVDYQSNIEYYCDPGYTLVGMRTRSCLRSAQWSGEEPTCEPSLCPSLGKLFLCFTSLGYRNINLFIKRLIAEAKHLCTIKFYNVHILNPILNQCHIIMFYILI